MTAAERTRRERWKARQDARHEEWQQDLERKTLTKDNAKARAAKKKSSSNRRKKKVMPGRKNTLSGRLKSKKPRTKTAKLERVLARDRNHAFEAIVATLRRAETLKLNDVSLPLIPSLRTAVQDEAKELALEWLCARLEAYDTRGLDWIEALEYEVAGLVQEVKPFLPRKD